MQPPIEAQDAISAFFLYKVMAKLSSERQAGEEKVCALDLRQLMGDPRS